jgi:NADH dehydrogenase
MLARVLAHRPRIVVIGAGFGGLAVARGLRHVPVDVTVLDANNFHLFQPLLYQVATAGLDADDIAYPVRGTLRRQRNVRFRLGRVLSIDLDGKVIHLDDGHSLPYDRLVLAAGAISATFGVPGVEEHAFALKTLRDALWLRAHVLERVEHAAAHTDHDPSALSIGIVGGGPTGVELAGGVRELIDKVLRRDFPELDLRRARIVLVEATERVLGTFAPRLSDFAAQTLRSRNVELVLGTGVQRIEAGAVVLADGRRIEAGTIVWAAGVRANPLAATSGLETARGGRVIVDAHLRVPSHPDVFAIGDVAASPDADGMPLPQVAQVAIQGGRHVAAEIRAEIDGGTSAPFRYTDKGAMATIGRNSAVAELPSGLHLRGFPGWLAWLALHLVYLIGFRNRANVLVNWAWNYLTYDRGARLIGEDIALPRRD